MGSYSLISADSHINEPPDTFVERVPASLRDRAPHVQHTDDGDVLIFETGARESATSASASVPRTVVAHGA